MIRLDLVERIPNLIRWLLIPLASLLAYVLTGFVINILGAIFVFISSVYGGWNQKFFTYLVSPGVSGFAAIYISVILAPLAKRAVAIFISAVWFVIAGGMLAFAYWNTDWGLSLAVVSTAVGCGFALSMVQEEVLSEIKNDLYDDFIEHPERET